MMAASFAAVFVALYVAHMLADYWVQTPHQAQHKGADGWAGRLACAGHVASYTLTAAAVLATLAWRLDLDLSALRVIAGLVVSAVSHYWADRRSTLRALVAALDRPGLLPGKTSYYDAGGAAHLDQTWHIVWLLVATLVMV